MEQPQNSMLRGAFIGAIIVVAVAVAFLAYQSQSTKGGINYGDVVFVNYTMYYAKNYTQVQPAAVIKMKVGDAVISAAFDKKILGMKIGSRKKFTLAKDEAFGQYDISLLRQYPKYKTFNRTDTIALNQLRAVVTSNYNITEGATVRTTQYWPWPILIKKISGPEVTIYHEPLLNSLYLDPLILVWPLKVTALTNESATIEYAPKIGSPTDDEQLGRGRVIDIGSEKITVDYNRQFAGNDIAFDVAVLSIQKPA